MQCQLCVEEIPDDSNFCPECGSRQDLSAVGVIDAPTGANPASDLAPAQSGFQQPEQSFPPTPSPPSTQTTDVGEAFLQNIASDMVPQAGNHAPHTTGVVQTTAQTTPPATTPPPFQPNPGAGLAQSSPNQLGDSAAIGGQGDLPGPGGRQDQSSRQSSTKTDAVVDAMQHAERAKKANARSAWLSMNEEAANQFLGQIDPSLPSHLQDGMASTSPTRALDVETESVDEPASAAPSLTLLRRMAEIAVRRVARKRGVAVEAPQVGLNDGIIKINVTFNDDGRVLDSPSELANAFTHAIDTEMRLKGYDLVTQFALFRSQEGVVELVWGDVDDEPESDEELFACEACGHYPIHDDDLSCPSCGAEFSDEDEDEFEPEVSRGPGGPGRGGPPRRGGSGGPSRGGPGGPKAGGPGGPNRAGPGSPVGPNRGGPSRGSPSGGGPSGGGPSGGGPSGPGRGGSSGGGPPAGQSRSGPSRGGPGGPGRGGSSGGGPPAGQSRSGPSGGGPAGPSGGGPGGPGGPSRGGPSRGGPSGGGPGVPSRGGPSGGGPSGPGRGAPKRGGPDGPGGRSRGGPPKKKGPPGGPRR